jgi:hypothetical protein
MIRLLFAAMRGGVLAVALAVPVPVRAHGFGQRYELPLPLAVYLTSAALTVFLSFLAMAWFSRRADGVSEPPRYNLFATRLGRLLAAPALLLVLRLAGVGMFLLIVVAGLVGVQSPLKNIAPAFVWALWWVGFTYACALIGDVWALVNPFDTLFRFAEAAYARLRAGRRLSLRRYYPELAGVWPATALFLLFAWVELVWTGADSPASLAMAIIGYALFTWAGMFIFGRSEWLQRGEVFAIVFSLLARFSPTEFRTHGARSELNLRPYGAGLIVREPLSRSQLALVLCMLATVTFDGFRDTALWTEWATRLSESSRISAAAISTFGLLVVPTLLIMAYVAACMLMPRLANESRKWPRLAGLFVLTLLPIAIGYHIAHYLSFLVTASQYAIPLVSDPFGWGWNLFGGSTYFVRPGIVDAKTMWYLAVPVIIIAHVLAVCLAHRVALREFADRRTAVRSQYPLVALMIVYTMTSLWIIAQPIVFES